MNELAAETEETIHLTIRDGDTVLLIERIDSPHPVRTFTPLGARAPLHASSNGKAILACLLREEIDRYLAGGLEALTACAIPDREILADELRLIRKRGYAVSNEEQQVGVVSIAAAIRPHGGEPAGALSISGPKSRMTRNIHSDHGDKVRGMAGRIAASLPAGATALEASPAACDSDDTELTIPEKLSYRQPVNADQRSSRYFTELGWMPKSRAQALIENPLVA